MATVTPPNAVTIPEYQPIFSIVDKSLITPELAHEVFAQLEDSDVIVITREQIEDLNEAGGRDKRRKDGKATQGSKAASGPSGSLSARKGQQAGGSNTAGSQSGLSTSRGAGALSNANTSGKNDDEDADDDARFTLSDEVIERLKDMIPRLMDEKMEEFVERKRAENEREEMLRNPQGSQPSQSSSGSSGGRNKDAADRKKSVSVSSKVSNANSATAHAQQALVSKESELTEVTTTNVTSNKGDKQGLDETLCDDISKADIKGLELILGKHRELGQDGLPCSGPSISASLKEICKPNHTALHFVLDDIVRKPGDAQKLAAVGIELSAILIIRFESEDGKPLVWNPNEKSNSNEFGSGGPFAYQPSQRSSSISQRTALSSTGISTASVTVSSPLQSEASQPSTNVTNGPTPSGVGKGRSVTSSQSNRPSSSSSTNRPGAQASARTSSNTRHSLNSTQQTQSQIDADSPTVVSNSQQASSQLVQIPSFTPGVAVTSLSLREAAKAIFHIQDEGDNSQIAPFPTLPGELAMIVAADPRFRDVCCFYVRAVKPTVLPDGLSHASGAGSSRGLGLTTTLASASTRQGGANTAKAKTSQASSSSSSAPSQSTSRLSTPTAGSRKAGSGSGSAIAPAATQSGASSKDSVSKTEGFENLSQNDSASTSIDLATAALQTSNEIRLALRQMAIDRLTFTAWMHKVPAVAFPVLPAEAAVDTRVYNCLLNNIPTECTNDISILLGAMFEQVAVSVTSSPSSHDSADEIGGGYSQLTESDYSFALPSGPGVGVVREDPVDAMKHEVTKRDVSNQVEKVYASLLDATEVSHDNVHGSSNLLERDYHYSNSDLSKSLHLLSFDDHMALALVRAALNGDHSSLDSLAAFVELDSNDSSALSKVKGLSALFSDVAKMRDSELKVPGAGGKGLPSASERAASIMMLSKAERGVALALLSKSTTLSSDELERALVVLAFEEMLAKPSPDFSICEKVDNAINEGDGIRVSRSVLPCLAQGDPEIEDAVAFRIRELQENGILCKVGQGFATHSKNESAHETRLVSDVDAHISLNDHLNENRFGWLALKSGIASRTLREPLSKSALLARLANASFSVTDTVHTQARYFPLLDSLLIAIQAYTPADRKKMQDWSAFFCPNLNFSEWRAADQNVRSSKPRAVYKFNVPHTGLLSRAATILYPCDQSRLARLHSESGRSKWTWLVVEKDDVVVLVEDVLIDCTATTDSSSPESADNSEQPASSVGFAAFSDSAGMRAMLQAGKDSRILKPVRTFTTQFEDNSRIFVTYDDDSQNPPIDLNSDDEVSSCKENALSKVNTFKAAYTTSNGVLSELHVGQRLVLTPAKALSPVTGRRVIYGNKKKQELSILDLSLSKPTPSSSEISKVELPNGSLKEIQRSVDFSGILSIVFEDGSSYRLHPDSSISTTKNVQRSLLPAELFEESGAFADSSIQELVTLRTDPLGNTWVALARNATYDPPIIRENYNEDIGCPYSWRVDNSDLSDSLEFGSSSQATSLGTVPVFLPREKEVQVQSKLSSSKVQACAFTYDPLTRAHAFTRADFTQFVLYSNGNSLCQFVDGTRIYRDVVKRSSNPSEVEFSSAVLFYEQPHSCYPCVTISTQAKFQLSDLSNCGPDDLQPALERTESTTIEVLCHDGTMIRGLANNSVTLQRSTGAFFVCSAPSDNSFKDKVNQHSSVLSFAALPEEDPREPLPRHIVFVPDDTVHNTISALNAQSGVLEEDGSMQVFSKHHSLDLPEGVSLDHLNFEALIRGEVPRSFAGVSKGAYCIDMSKGSIKSQDIENNDFLLELVPKNPKKSSGAEVRLLRDTSFGQSNELGATSFTIPSKYYMAPTHPLPARLFVLRATDENSNFAANVLGLNVEAGLIPSHAGLRDFAMTCLNKSVHLRGSNRGLQHGIAIAGYELLSLSQLNSYMRSLKNDPKSVLLKSENILHAASDDNHANLVTRRILQAIRRAERYRRIPTYSSLIQSHVSRYGSLPQVSSQVYEDMKVFAQRQFFESPTLDHQAILLVWGGLEASPSYIPSGLAYNPLTLSNSTAVVMLPNSLDYIASEYRIAALLTQQNTSSEKPTVLGLASPKVKTRVGVMGVELGDRAADELEKELSGWAKQLNNGSGSHSPLKDQAKDSSAIVFAQEESAEQLQLLVLRAREKLAERRLAERQALAEYDLYSSSGSNVTEVAIDTADSSQIEGISGSGSLSKFTVTSEILLASQAELDTPIQSQTALSVFSASKAKNPSGEGNSISFTSLGDKVQGAGWKSVGVGKQLFEKYHGIPSPNASSADSKNAILFDVNAFASREYRIRRILLQMAQRVHPCCPKPGSREASNAMVMSIDNLMKLRTQVSDLEIEDVCIDSTMCEERRQLAYSVSEKSLAEQQAVEVQFKDNLRQLLDGLSSMFELIARVFSNPYDPSLRTITLNSQGSGVNVWKSRVCSKNNVLESHLPALLVQLGYLPVIEDLQVGIDSKPIEFHLNVDPLANSRVNIPGFGDKRVNAFSSFLQVFRDDDLKRMLNRFRAQVLKIGSQFQIESPPSLSGAGSGLGFISGEDLERADEVKQSITESHDKHFKGIDPTSSSSWTQGEIQSQVYRLFAGKTLTLPGGSSIPSRLRQATLAYGGKDPKSGEYVVRHADDSYIASKAAREAAAATAEGRALLLLSEDASDSGHENRSFSQIDMMNPSDNNRVLEDSDDEEHFLASSDKVSMAGDKDWISVASYDKFIEETSRSKHLSTSLHKQKFESKLRSTALEPIEHVPRGKSFNKDFQPPLSASAATAALQALSFASQVTSAPQPRAMLKSREYDATGSRRPPGTSLPLPEIYGKPAEPKPYTYYHGSKQGLKTASTFARSSVESLAAGLPTCTLLPSKADFGVCREGVTYRLTLALTNTSSTIARFQVGQPVAQQDALYLLRSLYRPGAVAPGMTKNIEIELYASQPCKIDSNVTIVTERDIFEVPIIAEVLSSADFANKNPRTATSPSSFAKSFQTQSKTSTLANAGSLTALGSTFKPPAESPRVKQHVARSQEMRRDVLEVIGPAVSPPSLAAETTSPNPTYRFGKLGQPRAISDKPSAVTAQYLEEILAQQKEELMRENERKRAMELRDAQYKRELEHQDGARKARAEALEALRMGKNPLAMLNN